MDGLDSGWEYGPGNVNDAGSWFGGQYPEYVSSGSAVNFGTGWGDTLQSMLKTYGNTWAQTTLLQKNVQGQAYIEGQRARMSLMNQGVGLNMGTVLVLGGIVALVFLLKD